MKPIKSFLTTIALLSLALCFCQTAQAVVTFTITPSAVSNTFGGTIALSVSGLISGDAVVIQDYLDANTNDVIDGGDILWQQFNLTDGQQSIFHNGAAAVTNFNVPGDTDGTANGTIVAKYVFQAGSPQAIAGKYAFRLYSPAGHFTPITNLFVVTNFPYAQSFTGNVVSNGTSTTLTNAIVLLFDVSSGNLHVVGGAVANNAGSYTIKAPPGTYTLAAIKSNFVASTTVAANLVLGGGATVTTNVNLLSTTQSISGRVVDANNSSLGIAGFLVPVQTQNGLLSVTFTDTNGNFTARVNANQWKVEGNEEGLMTYGYLALQNSTTVDTSTGSVSGVTIAVPKATAIFYGTAKDTLNHPLAGISLNSQQQDNNYQYQSEGITDANGNYVAGALAGDWSTGVNSDSNPTNYDFSQGNNATLTNGQAYQQNFTAILATNHITGHVQDNNSNPIGGVAVSANATISSVNFQAQVDTDTSGNYSLNVANGSWSVNVNCNGGDDSLDGILGSGNYACPNQQNVVIANNNQAANFTVQVCGGVEITTTSPLPDGQAGSPYDFFLQAASCNPSFNWSQTAGSLPSGFTLETTGELHGTTGASGTFNFTVQVTDGNSSLTNKALSLIIATNSVPPPPLNVVMSGNQAVVFYPQSGTNYTLQTTTNLATGPWVPATNGVSVIALTFSNTAPAAFFRLR